VADVIAAVVQKRGVSQGFAIRLRAAESLADGVEENQRELLDVRGMRLLDVAACCKFGHRSRAGIAWVGDGRSDARRLEEEAFSDAIWRYRQLTALEPSQHFGRDRDPGDDDVRALRIQAWHRAPLLGRHVDEDVENVLELRARNVRRVHRASGENALSR